ncbi:MAG: DUF6165 family protein [Prochlorococcaceae cyanobacterium]
MPEPGLKQDVPVLQVAVSVGELVDKLTILELKRRHLRGEALGHAQREHQLLEQVFLKVAVRVPSDLHEQLGLVNAELWAVEDAIRACDRRGDFGPGFIELARSVYRLNDRRAAIKRAINLASGSALIEEKCYDGSLYAGGSDEVRPTT